VLLGEPSRTPYDLNFVLFGIPVRVHPLFWLIGLLLGPHRSGGPAILAWMLAFFIGILGHEWGHDLVIRRQGGQPWIVLYGLGGLAFGNRASGGWPQIAVSAAGPAAGFLMAALVAAGVAASGHRVEVLLGAPLLVLAQVGEIVGSAALTQWINSFFFVTIVYGVLNLLPIYPLDGGQIARELFVMALGRDGVRHSLILSMITAGTLAAAAAVFWHLFVLALFFGYFAYASFAALQSMSHRGPWY